MNSLAILLAAVCLNGPWAFKFEEDKPLEASSGAAFVADDVMSVPGCWDVLPRYYLKHGTGLYLRTFTLEKPMKDAVLVVDGMGLRATFAIDGVAKGGVQSYPYARLEIPVGPLAAGAHEIFAAVDNIQEWPRVKLARPYYDFYFYGGFYHGMKLVEKAPKVFVRTRDYATAKIEVEVEGPVPGDTTLKIDERPVVAEWKDGRAVVTVPNARLWSPEDPNLHVLKVMLPGDVAQPDAVTFGIRQVEAKANRIFLNGKPLFLKGFNRHESSMLEGSATGDATMLRDIQNLKAVGGNFLRGAHYQQCERFLELCDRLGVLVWEESLGWGNGQAYTRQGKVSEPEDAEFRDMQERQTREMVRASFNHPSVIIYGFLNECASDTPAVKTLVDRLVATIRKEDSGRLVTFACNNVDADISCENVDLVSINAYPGTIPMTPGRPETLKKQVEDRFDSAIARFGRLYPEKPVIVSESGCGGVAGMRDPLNASPNTEDFQDEYLRDILSCLWANPRCSGFAIWQMNDGRTRERFWTGGCSSMFGGSVAGCFDEMRRPKKSVATVKSFFSQK